MTGTIDQLISPKTADLFDTLIPRMRNQGNLFFNSGELRELGSDLGDLELLDVLIDAFVTGEKIYYTWKPDATSKQAGCYDRQSRRFLSLDIPDYLEAIESAVTGNAFNHPPAVIDFSPCSALEEVTAVPDLIGQGSAVILKHLKQQLGAQADDIGKAFYSLLKDRLIGGRKCFLDSNVIGGPEALVTALRRVIGSGGQVAAVESGPAQNLEQELSDLLESEGFLPGFGDTPDRILETLELLHRILVEGKGGAIEPFLLRLPLVSRVLLLSPHGFFAQKDVLGKPDTGGQVVYILDEVKALEKELQERLLRSGLDISPLICILTRLISESEGTTCHIPLENVEGTSGVTILRVPFKTTDGMVVPEWIPRFRIWPYLQRFASDARQAITDTLDGKPDLIVGNYSDGNLVAFLLSQDFEGVPFAIVAHALEKSKYAFSDSLWEQHQDEYHFAEQFTADLLVMNSADFVITSTRQEIVGTDHTEGQYQCYQFFTLPGMFRVLNGIDTASPRFNVIPPGVDLDVYHPRGRGGQEELQRTASIRNLLFRDQEPDIFGRLDDHDKRPFFTMARLDTIKNITGLVEAFGRSGSLREKANLVLIAGKVNRDQADSDEEKRQIDTMYDLIDTYDLHGSIRWLGIGLPKPDAAETYRVIADCRGLFIQPALYEAFGLTVLEAMHSGIPTAATMYGGPLEIIQEGENGFLLDTRNPGGLTARLEWLIEKMDRDTGLWKKISEAGIKRVAENFTWPVYSRAMLRAASVIALYRQLGGEERRQVVKTCADTVYEQFFSRLLTR